MEGKPDKDNRIFDDGMTVTEMDATDKVGDRLVIPYLTFARYKGNDAGGTYYWASAKNSVRFLEVPNTHSLLVVYKTKVVY